MYVHDLRAISIGRQNDGKCHEVRIDCTEWLNIYPQLTNYRIEVTTPKGFVYLPEVTFEHGVLTWRIQQSDTAETGTGMYQVVAEGENGARKTSSHQKLVVLSIMDGTAQETPPDPSKTWVDKVTADAERAELAANKAETAAIHTPIIGENGNWHIWQDGAYVDSGYSASPAAPELPYKTEEWTFELEDGTTVTKAVVVE